MKKATNLLLYIVTVAFVKKAQAHNAVQPQTLQCSCTYHTWRQEGRLTWLISLASHMALWIAGEFTSCVFLEDDVQSTQDSANDRTQLLLTNCAYLYIPKPTNNYADLFTLPYAANCTSHTYLSQLLVIITS